MNPAERGAFREDQLMRAIRGEPNQIVAGMLNPNLQKRSDYETQEKYDAEVLRVGSLLLVRTRELFSQDPDIEKQLPPRFWEDDYSGSSLFQPAFLLEREGKAKVKVFKWKDYFEVRQMRGSGWKDRFTFRLIIKTNPKKPEIDYVVDSGPTMGDWITSRDDLGSVVPFAGGFIRRNFELKSQETAVA